MDKKAQKKYKITFRNNTEYADTLAEAKKKRTKMRGGYAEPGAYPILLGDCPCINYEPRDFIITRFEQIKKRNEVENK